GWGCHFSGKRPSPHRLGVVVGYDCFHDPSKTPTVRFEKLSVFMGPMSILYSREHARYRPRSRALLRHGGGKQRVHPSLQTAASHSVRHYPQDQAAGGHARATAVRQDGAAAGTDSGGEIVLVHCNRSSFIKCW